MNTSQKMKGKKLPKTIKEKSNVNMECPEPDKKKSNKKRKHFETEDETVSLVQKKSKRKRNGEETSHLDSINNQFSIVNSNKKKLEHNEMSTTLGNEENYEQQNYSQINMPNKTRKKTKVNNELVLNSNLDLEVKDEYVSSDKIPQVTVKDTTSKNRKKIAKQHKGNSFGPQNGDLCTNEEVLNNSYENQDLSVDNLKSSNKEDVLMNSISNSLPSFNSDMEDNQPDIKSDIASIAYRSLNNNEKETKREVNVIDIKNEGSPENIEKIVTISIRDIEGANTNRDEDDLLKQLERKLKPKVPKETINWPKADLKELINRMEKCIPLNDIKPFSRTLEEMDWTKILFKDYTLSQCKCMWLKLQKKIRKYRILNEVLQDAKYWVDSYTQPRTNVAKKKGRPQKHPDMPRKPLTAYFLFYLENRDSYLTDHPGVDASEVTKALGQKFQNLSLQEKKKYEAISLQKKEEYKKKLEEFYEAHPEIPREVKDSKSKAEKIIKSPKIVKEKTSPKLSIEKPLPAPSKEKLLPTPSKEKPLPKCPKEKPAKPLKEKVLPKLPKDKVPIRPHPPFHYFYVSELGKENVDDKAKFKEICKERWKHLPERNKLVWIQYAEAELAKYEEEMKEYVKKHPDHITNPLKTILSKEDVQIKDRAAGKPIKPPGSAYNLFASKLLQSTEIKKVPVRDRLIFVSNQWKYCTEDEKKVYKDMYNELINKYKEEYTTYLENLTEDERKEELEKNSQKIIKSKKEKMKSHKEHKNKKENLPRVNKTVTQQTEKLKEPQQPPISPYKYFCSIYTGEEPTVQVWKALTKEQKKNYEAELIEKKKEYIRDFEKFLKSLTEQELEEFSKSRRKAKEEQQENEDEESDSYDSDDSTEDDDEEEPDEK